MRDANDTPIYIRNFKLKHCISSKIADLENINNYPGSDFHPGDSERSDPKLQKNSIIESLHKLFKYCINPIMLQFENDIALTSVYRNKRLNELLGGVPNSQHIYGYAADIVPLGGKVTTAEIFNYCLKFLPLYHQVIWEYPEKGEFTMGSNQFAWIHISYIEGNNFRENSVSSLNPKIHEYYEGENTYRIGNFTHRIKEASNQLLSDLEL